MIFQILHKTCFVRFSALFSAPGGGGGGWGGGRVRCSAQKGEFLCLPAAARRFVSGQSVAQAHSVAEV